MALFHGKKRRGAAADIEGVESAPRRDVKVHFCEERFEKFIHVIAGGCRAKVTVGALFPAEGDVDVKTGMSMMLSCHNGHYFYIIPSQAKVKVTYW